MTIVDSPVREQWKSGAADREMWKYDQNGKGDKIYEHFRQSLKICCMQDISLSVFQQSDNYNHEAHSQ